MTYFFLSLSLSLSYRARRIRMVIFALVLSLHYSLVRAV